MPTHLHMHHPPVHGDMPPEVVVEPVPDPVCAPVLYKGVGGSIIPHAAATVGAHTVHAKVKPRHEWICEAANQGRHQCRGYRSTHPAACMMHQSITNVACDGGFSAQAEITHAPAPVTPTALRSFPLSAAAAAQLTSFISMHAHTCTLYATTPYGCMQDIHVRSISTHAGLLFWLAMPVWYSPPPHQSRTEITHEGKPLRLQQHQSVPRMMHATHECTNPSAVLRSPAAKGLPSLSTAGSSTFVTTCFKSLIAA